MSRIFVWEASTRSGLALLYQPAIYYDGLPTKLSGEPKPAGTFIFVHHELETEKEWGLFRFCNTYPCPATRKVNDVDQVVQSSKDINKTQAGEGLARYLDRVIAGGGDGGSTATHYNETDERSTQDQRRHDIERIGGNGSETQGAEIHRTGKGQTQDSMASDNGDLQMTCNVCGTETDDLRFGVCFDCATKSDIRLAKKSTMQHWLHGFLSIWERNWWRAKMDFKCGWERIWRTGEYAPGREWQDY